MPCFYETFFSIPRYLCRANLPAADAGPVMVDIRLKFHQSITWWLHGSPHDHQRNRHSIKLREDPSCFAELSSTFVYVQSVLDFLSEELPLPGGQEKLYSLALRVAEFIHESLENIPTEEVVWTGLVVEIKMKADLDLEAAEMMFGLEREVYNGGHEHQECSVCMEEFEQGTEVSTTPCGHCFHERCIVRWVKVVGNCPLCRRMVPIGFMAEGAVFCGCFLFVEHY